MNLSIKNCFLFVICCFAAYDSSAQSVGGTTSGSATYCDNNGAGFITLVGNTGTYFWESSIDGGMNWTATGSCCAGQSYNNLTQTTCYRAIVQNAAFPPDTSTVSCITILAPTIGGAISGGGTFCVTSGSGTLNLTGNTGNVLSWQSSTDSGSTWSTISNTTISLNYTNITQNTLYAAVVQNTASCLVDTSSTAFFIIDPMTNGGIVSANDTVCAGSNSGTLNISGLTGSVITWVSSIDSGATWILIPNTADTLDYFNLTSTTYFTAIVQSGSCPADTSAFAFINVLSRPLVSAGNDTSIIEGQGVTLNGSGGGWPVWFPSTGLNSSGIFNPVATPLVTTTYVLTVTDTNNCASSDAVIVTVLPGIFDGMVSNLFTPNSDGINDTWYIEDIQNFPENEVLVFNIYGDEVYTKKGYTNDWAGTYNGSALPDGTYYYVLRFEDSEKVFKGSIDILRSK
jgi:gliding motility-associated-like protein